MDATPEAADAAALTPDRRVTYTDATDDAAALTPGRRVTAGPVRRASLEKPLVPTGLLDSLHALDVRILSREAALLEEKNELAAERARFERQVKTVEWRMQEESHRLALAQEQWHRQQQVATAVSGYQDRRLVIGADGGEISTTVATLLTREENSGLAILARQLLQKDLLAGGKGGGGVEVEGRPHTWRTPTPCTFPSVHC